MSKQNTTVRRIASFYKFKLGNVWHVSEEHILVNIKNMPESERTTLKGRMMDRLTKKIQDLVEDSHGVKVAATLSLKVTPKEIEMYKNRKMNKKNNDKLAKARNMVTYLLKQDPILFGKAHADYVAVLAARRKEYVLHGMMAPENSQLGVDGQISEKLFFSQDCVQNVPWVIYADPKNEKFKSVTDAYNFVIRAIHGFESEMYNKNFTFKEMCDSVVADYEINLDKTLIKNVKKIPTKSEALGMSRPKHTKKNGK